MKKLRIIITLFVLVGTNCLFGAANSDKIKVAKPKGLRSVFTPGTMFIEITGAFNINNSIRKGVDENIFNQLKTSLKEHKIPNVQVEKSLQGAFEFVNEKVRDYHQLYQTLIGEVDTDWDINQIKKLAKLFKNKPDFATKLYDQSVKQGDFNALATMTQFLKQANNNKSNALLLVIKFPKSRSMIPVVYRRKLLVELVEQDFLQFEDQRAKLGRIIQEISAKAREDSSIYPELWIKSVPWSANDILKGRVRYAIYEEFRKKFNSIIQLTDKLEKYKQMLSLKGDLKSILARHKHASDEDIKILISQLERYRYQIENYRPKLNLTWGISTLTDSARYQDHLAVSTELLQLLRELYPSIISDLDSRLQMAGKYNSSDLSVLAQAGGYDAVIFGIIKEVKKIEEMIEKKVEEIKHKSIEQKMKSIQFDGDDNGWGIL